MLFTSCCLSHCNFTIIKGIFSCSIKHIGVQGDSSFGELGIKLSIRLILLQGYHISVILASVLRSITAKDECPESFFFSSANQPRLKEGFPTSGNDNKKHKFNFKIPRSLLRGDSFALYYAESICGVRHHH